MAGWTSAAAAEGGGLRNSAAGTMRPADVRISENAVPVGADVSRRQLRGDGAPVTPGVRAHAMSAADRAGGAARPSQSPRIAASGPSEPAGYSASAGTPARHASTMGSMMRQHSSASSPRIESVGSPSSTSRITLP